jgi:hypothetical protein
MPTTAENITRILKHVSNYSREEIMGVLSEVQNIVYATDSEQTIKLNPNNGLPPFLETIDEQYEYDCPSDCRRTAVIFTESWPYPYSRINNSITWKEYYFKHRGWYENSISSRDALPSNNQLAKVYFLNNPGTTTEKFYHYYYILPTEITDESIQLTVPDHVHWRMRKMVISLLSEEQYGQTGVDERIIEKQIKKVRSELNAGAKSTSRSTPWQSEFMDYFGDWQGHRR